MFKSLNYLNQRSQQICTVFLFTLITQKLLNFLHSGWIGFTVMMIYVGYDTGTSLHRTMHRFWGTLLGLLLAFVLIGVIRVHASFILLVIPCTLFMAFFSLGKLYAYPTIFTVTLTALGLDYYPSDQYHLYEFLFDYFRATLAALGLCVFFEYFIFKRNNLTPYFYLELEKKLTELMQQLTRLANETPSRHSQFLKLSAEFNARLIEFNQFIMTMQHDYHHSKDIQRAQLLQQTLISAYQEARQLMVISQQQRSL
jgi:hypothetical protein